MGVGQCFKKLENCPVELMFCPAGLECGHNDTKLVLDVGIAEKNNSNYIQSTNRPVESDQYFITFLD